MPKFKHGLPVSSAVMTGFLSVEKGIGREALIPLAIAMVLSEEGSQDFNRMAQVFQADVGLARQFKLPDEVGAATAWTWRFEGLQILREATMWLVAEMQQQAQRDLSRRQAATAAFQSSVVLDACKSKLGKEQKLVEEAVRMALLQ